MNKNIKIIKIPLCRFNTAIKLFTRNSFSLPWTPAAGFSQKFVQLADLINHWEVTLGALRAVAPLSGKRGLSIGVMRAKTKGKIKGI